MNIITTLSPHKNERKIIGDPDYIILHYTGTPTLQDAVHYFMDEQSEKPVSAHYMIDEDGTTYRFVADDERAWHAGRSYWRGITDMNSHSIGIEIVNPGHDHGYRPFPLAQMNVVKKLVTSLKGKYNIPNENIIGHSDIAPERKIDPGEYFSWRDLAEEGMGIWFDISIEDEAFARSILPSTDAIRSGFSRWGFDPEASLETINFAFQQHYLPEFVLAQNVLPVTDLRVLSRLASLLRLRDGKYL
jgi:N-acetylmuramoyl-L-alanine amidase